MSNVDAANVVDSSQDKNVMDDANPVNPVQDETVMGDDNPVNSSQDETQKTTPIEPKKQKSFNPLILVGIIVIVVGAFFILNQPITGLIVATNDSTDSTEVTDIQVEEDEELVEITPFTFAIRQRFFEEAFQPRRQDYDLFEKASEHLGIPIEDVPEYFSLNAETDIFLQLPEVPEDFGEVAYLLASGRNYAVGVISEDYFLQPEFYPNFKEIALKYWEEPDPKYWTTNGFGTYPAEQFDTLSLTGRTEFQAVVLFYTGFGVQTYQGATIIPTTESLERFDIEITPDTFLLTPTFPYFSSDWVHQVVITGKLKPGIPPGEYQVGFLVVDPPIEKYKEWLFKYRNIYFNAASAIAPAGFPITFRITVLE